MKMNRHYLGISFVAVVLALLWMFTGGAAFSASNQAKALTKSQASLKDGLSITTPRLNDAFVEVLYDQQLKGTGCTTCYWEIVSGGPFWLSIGRQTGVLTGTPGPGDVSYGIIIISLADGTGNVVTKDFRLRVTQPLEILTESLPDGLLDENYFEKIFLQGGNAPLLFDNGTDNGTCMPFGLKLDKTTGNVSGIPAEAGGSLSTVRVSDSSEPKKQRDHKPITVNINAGDTLTITTSGELPQAIMGKEMAPVTLEAKEGEIPYTWSISQGFLPAGLSLSAEGVISGTPNDKGDFFFTVQVIDDEQSSAEKACHLYIAEALGLAKCPPASVALDAPFLFAFAPTGGTAPFKPWKLVSGKGNLPDGLHLGGDNGTLHGTPSTDGQSETFTVRVTDNSVPPQTAYKKCTMAVTSNPLFTTITLPDGKVGYDYPESTISWRGGSAVYSFEITKGVLPVGLNWSAGPGPEAVTISGKPETQEGGKIAFTACLKDGGACVSEQEFSIYIVPNDVEISTESLKAAVSGMAYQASIEADGGKKPYRQQLVEGQLPLGLGLNSTSGQISGTPEQAGDFTFTVQVTDSASSYAERKLSIAVAKEPVHILPKDLARGERNVLYSESIAAAGGVAPYKWTKNGAWPKGLEFIKDQSNSVIISGTPEQDGNFTFTVTVEDSYAKDDETFTIKIAKPVEIVTEKLVSDKAEVGVSYPPMQFEAADGWPGDAGYTWTIASGSLPPGLTLTSEGILQGTPEQAGTYSFKVQVTDSLGGVALSKEFKIEVREHVAITTDEIEHKAEMGVKYGPVTFLADLGWKGYTWTIAEGSLPPGLNLTSGGILQGTPTQAGTYSFKVQVTDSLGGVALSKRFKIEVREHVAISTETIENKAEIGEQYGPVTFSAELGWGGYTWTITEGSVPPPLALTSAGILQGTPTQAGTYNFKVQVTDSLGGVALSNSFTIKVKEHVVISTGTIQKEAEIGEQYGPVTLLAKLGWKGYTWYVDKATLPKGLDLDPGTGILQGKPANDCEAKEYTFTVQVTDSLSPVGATATQKFTIEVKKHVVITTTQLAHDLAEVGYKYGPVKFSAELGWGGYTWYVDKATLPKGLSLDPGTGILQGVPKTNGGTKEFTFTVQVRDSLGATASKEFTLTVYEKLKLTTKSLHNGVVDQSFTAKLKAQHGAPEAVGKEVKYTWTISSGNLPDGLALAEETGTISGYPTTPGKFAFTATVKDALQPVKASDSNDLSIVVLRITPDGPGGLPLGVQGFWYETQLQVDSGGTKVVDKNGYKWSVVKGKLPPGLGLNPTTGKLEGTPTAFGVFSFNVQAQGKGLGGETLTVTEKYNLEIFEF